MEQLLELLLNNIEIVSSGLFALLSIIFGSKWKIFKDKLAQAAEVVKEIEKALKDDKVTKEELDEIIKDLKILLGKNKK